jgi:hypothetical protein
MKKSLVVLITFLLVILVVSACSLLPGSQSSNTELTPNMTLTALFDTSKNIPATVTPIYVVVTNTPEPATAVPTEAPTATAVPATATTVPTTTAAVYLPPAPTAVPVMQRPGSLMQAGYISSVTPVIDGSWSEWKDYTTMYPISAVVYGKSNWTGASDLEASFGAVWDYTYLYLGVKVHDDSYVQNATGADIYKGDSIEILVDKNLQADYYTQALNSDDYQLGISAGNSSAGIPASAYLWFPSGSNGTKSDVTIGFTTESNNIYRYEARIPWSVFGINPSTGMHLGFVVSVSDNDNASQNIQQTMISSDPYRSLVDPTTWGEIVLTK